MQRDIELPPPGTNAILRLEQVERLVGISRTSIWRYERLGMFPQKFVILGAAMGYSQQEIEAWIEARKNAGRDDTEGASPRPQSE